MWRSTFVPETIFRRSIRPKQTDRTGWTIWTHSDELNWAGRRTFHQHNSLSLVRLMKSSTFGLGLSPSRSCNYPLQRLTIVFSGSGISFICSLGFDILKQNRGEIRFSKYAGWGRWIPNITTVRHFRSGLRDWRNILGSVIIRHFLP